MTENINEDVWTDPETGLMWQVKIARTKFLWKETGSYADLLNYSNYGGSN